LWLDCIYVIVAAGAGTQLLRSTESLRENKKIAFKILGEMEAIISIHNPKLEIIRKKFVRSDRNQFV
jgi:hypothetical protein